MIVSDLEIAIASLSFASLLLLAHMQQFRMQCNTMHWPMVCSAVVGKQGSAVKDLVPRIVGSTLELELEKKV